MEMHTTNTSANLATASVPHADPDGSDPGPAATVPGTAHPGTLPERAVFIPWVDRIVDERGHDPRSLYVEQFWLGVLGPTVTWLLRRVVARFDRYPQGYEIDLELLAGALGISTSKGRRSALGRALSRCAMFELARPLPTGGPGWEFRRKLPTVKQRHLRRLPDAVQRLHEQWHHVPRHPSGIDRAQRLASAMVSAGDDPELVEPQLLALGVPPRAASAVCEKLLRAS